jgi:thiosulfate dehydrogenase
MNRTLLFIGFLLICAAGACGDQAVPAAELGERLFASTSVSTSRANRYTCASCHSVRMDAPLVAPGLYDSGYNLHGAAARTGWWGGYSSRLLDAINVCVTEFMGGRKLLPEEPAARQLGEYLLAESAPGPQPAAPLTIVRVVTPLDGMTGDPTRGSIVYLAGCQRCHGNARTGGGRLDETFPVVPEETIRAFGVQARYAVIEKVRHGRFFNIGGVMPLFTLEAMSDADLVDMLAYLGL